MAKEIKDDDKEGIPSGDMGFSLPFLRPEEDDEKSAPSTPERRTPLQRVLDTALKPVDRLLQRLDRDDDQGRTPGSWD